MVAFERGGRCEDVTKHGPHYEGKVRVITLPLAAHLEHAQTTTPFFHTYINRRKYSTVHLCQIQSEEGYVNMKLASTPQTPQIIGIQK